MVKEGTTNKNFVESRVYCVARPVPLSGALGFTGQLFLRHVDLSARPECKREREGAITSLTNSSYVDLRPMRKRVRRAREGETHRDETLLSHPTFLFGGVLTMIYT